MQFCLQLVRWQRVAIRHISIGLVLAGCGTGSPVDSVTVVDSAGVRIVTNPVITAMDAPACHVSPNPTLTIGDAIGEPGHELYRVFGASRLTDGRIVVANQGSSELRYFAADGRYLMSLGRDGEGPAEFRKLRQIVRHAGDSLLAWDDGLQRWTAVGLDGGFGQSVTLRPAFMNPPRLLGVTSDDVMWVEYRERRTPTGPQFVDQHLRLFRINQDGQVVDTVGTFRYGSQRVIDAEAHFVGGPLFEALHEFAIWGDTIYSGHGDAPEIEVRDEKWRLLGLIRWTNPDRAIPAEDLAAYRAQRVDGISDPRFRRLAERRWELTPVSDRYPAFQEMMVDDAGNLWVKRFPRLASGVRWWLAFAPDGEFICQATLPDDFVPSEFGIGYVLGLNRNEMGVERVLQYAIDIEVR